MTTAACVLAAIGGLCLAAWASYYAALYFTVAMFPNRDIPSWEVDRIEAVGRFLIFSGLAFFIVAGAMFVLGLR